MLKLNKNKKKYLNWGLLVLLVISVITNQVLLIRIQTKLHIDHGLISRISSVFVLGSKVSNNTKLVGDLSKDSIVMVMMHGSPNIYGQTMGVNFDQVQNSINIMKQYDPDYGTQKLSLSSDNMKRYKKIALKISCEYCCGAASIIFSDGRAACGCAHSQAMRGLLSYLLANYGDKYSDDQLLRELAYWKGRYFPKQMMQKLTKQIASNNYTPDIAALLLDIKLPKYKGLNSGTAPLPSSIDNLPSMVGGC